MLENKLKTFLLFLKNNLWSLLLDCFFLSIVFVFVILEVLGKFKLCNNVDITLEVLTALLPTIITIISISIQIQNDKIYGLSLREFQKLRTGLHFSLIHMIVVSIVVFLLNFVFLFIDYKDISFYLIVISLIYSFLFVITELPILTKNDQSLQKVVKGFCNKHFKRICENKKQDEYDYFAKALNYLVFNRGIKETFGAIKPSKVDDNQFLSFLLDKCNEYLFGFKESVDIQKLNNCLDLEECDLVIKNGFANLSVLMDIRSDFNYLLFDKTGIETYHLSRMTYSLQYISKTIGFKDNKIKNFLYPIVSNYLFNLGGSNKTSLYNSYIVSMAASTLSAGDNWFVKMLRDFDYPHILYDFENDLIFYFLTLHMCFLCNSNMFSDGHKQNIKDFLSEQSHGLNSDGQSWISRMRKSLDNVNDCGVLIIALEKLLDLYSSINNIVCDIHPKMMIAYNYDDNTHFSKELIIDYWIGLLLFHPYIYIDSDQCIDYFRKMKPENQELVSSALSYRWLENDAIKQDSVPAFFLFLYNNHETTQYNKGLLNGLVKFRDKCSKERHQKEQKKLDDTVLVTIKKEIDLDVPKIIDELHLPGGVDLSKEKGLYYWIRLEGNDVETLLKMYLSQLKNSIQLYIHKQILNLVDKKPTDNYKYNSRDIDSIILLKPNISSDISRLIYSCNEKQVEMVRKLGLVKKPYMPRDTFARIDSIKIGAEYINELSEPRFASQEEIETIIDEEYKESNGLYRYSDYKGDYANSFLVTRDELKTLLSNRIVFVPIVIKISSFVSDKTGIISFARKKDDELGIGTIEEQS